MMTFEEIQQLLTWAKLNDVLHIKIADVDVSFAPVVKPEAPVRPAPKRDVTAWVDEQLFGQRVDRQ